jgi:UDP-N-acetylglucosamine 2-epimerase (non-hydrolysing)
VAVKVPARPVDASIVRRWLVPFGTREEMVKLAPVVEALRDSEAKVRALAAFRHDDPELGDEFLSDLALETDVWWSLPSAECERVGVMMTRAFDTLASGDYHAVLLVGGGDIAVSFALAARRFGIPIVHLEAGLRSFDAQSPWEGNRRIISTLAALHLAPTQLAARLLDVEGVPPARVRVVGNPVTDSLRQLGPRRCRVGDRSGVLATLDHPPIVDEREHLTMFVELLRELGAETGAVRFPVHPRTRDRLVRYGLLHDVVTAVGVSVEAPPRYGDLLEAIAHSRVVVTDNDALQEEAAWYRVPVVLRRRSTSRWESVMAGASVLAGPDVAAALDAVRRLSTPEVQQRVGALACPYGDGRVARRVAGILTHPSTDGLLEVREPDLTAAPPTLLREAHG